MRRNILDSSLLPILCILLLVLSSMAFFAFAAPNNPQVHIRADGTVEGTTSIQRAGNTYTFTGNVTAALYVDKPGVTVDGAGYTLTGGNRGVVMGQDVTLKNLRITLEGGYVIDLSDALNCTIENNTLVGTPKLIPDLPPGPLLGPIAINFLHSQNITVRNNTIINFFTALSLEWSSGHTITGNNLIDGVSGIGLWDSYNCTFRDNRLTNCSFSIRAYPGYEYQNDLDSSNTVAGKPIYYWIGAKDKAVPADAASVVLVNCSNITVKGSSPTAVTLVTTTNCTLSRLNMAGRGDGITLLNCSLINILDGKFSGQAIGIDIENSNDNIIQGNEISGHLTRGIDLGNANNNLIVNNTIADSSYAIAPFQDKVSNGNIIQSNVFRNNTFALTAQGSMQILNNTFVDNDPAILCYSGGNTISGNTFTGNTRAIALQSTGNILRNNRFVDNGESITVSAANFENDVDSSNTLNGKPMIYWVNQHDRTVPQDAGFVLLADCSGITVQNLTLINQNNGLLLAFTTNSTVTGNLIAGNVNGIYLHGASGNRFIGNNVTGNGYAVYIGGVVYAFFGAPGTYTPSSNNLFYHNNFVGNNATLYDTAGSYNVGSSPSANLWDNGKEGNYWSNYTGTDANGDGIGDTRYVVYANNTDNYPLMKAANVTVPQAAASPSPSPTPAATATPNVTPTLTPQPTPAATGAQTAAPTSNDNSVSPIEEFAPWIVLALLALVVTMVLVAKARLNAHKPDSGRDFT